MKVNRQQLTTGQWHYSVNNDAGHTIAAITDSRENCDKWADGLAKDEDTGEIPTGEIPAGTLTTGDESIAIKEDGTPEDVGEDEGEEEAEGDDGSPPPEGRRRTETHTPAAPVRKGGDHV